MSQKGPQLNQVVIMDIWGRAGGDGIPGLVEEIRRRLAPLHIPADHIFSISWNPNGNDDPLGSPDTSRHVHDLTIRESVPFLSSLDRAQLWRMGSLRIVSPTGHATKFRR